MVMLVNILPNEYPTVYPLYCHRTARVLPGFRYYEQPSSEQCVSGAHGEVLLEGSGSQTLWSQDPTPLAAESD